MAAAIAVALILLGVRFGTSFPELLALNTSFAAPLEARLSESWWQEHRL